MKDTIQTTLIMETQPELIQKTCQTLSSSLEDFLAKLSVLLENEEDLTKQEELSFLRLQGFSETSNPGTFYSKTLKAYYLMRGGETLETIFRVCDELGYDVSWKIYNSKNYGVPQNRERIFIKGYFRGKCKQEVLHFGGKMSEYNANKLVCLNDTSQVNSVYSSKGLCPTLDTWGELKIYDENFNDKRYVRLLIPVECERLQGFPDDWTKYGKDDEQISDTQRYKCCGNAVTTNVITAIVDEMFEGVKE